MSAARATPQPEPRAIIAAKNFFTTQPELVYRHEPLTKIGGNA
jgi:hypothetical protein